MVMAEKKLDYQFEKEDVWGSDDILDSNPLGKVPCLVMEGGEAMFDSRVIVEYLDARSPLGKLIPERTASAPKSTWEALADGVIDAGVLARLEATWPKRAAGSAARPGSTASSPRSTRRSKRSPRAWATSPSAAAST